MPTKVARCEVLNRPKIEAGKEGRPLATPHRVGRRKMRALCSGARSSKNSQSTRNGSKSLRSAGEFEPSGRDWYSAGGVIRESKFGAAKSSSSSVGAPACRFALGLPCDRSSEGAEWRFEGSRFFPNFPCGRFCKNDCRDQNNQTQSVGTHWHFHLANGFRLETGCEEFSGVRSRQR